MAIRTSAQPIRRVRPRSPIARSGEPWLVRASSSSRASFSAKLTAPWGRWDASSLVTTSEPRETGRGRGHAFAHRIRINAERFPSRHPSRGPRGYARAKRRAGPRLERAHESGAELIIVDLRGLEFMDSTGLHRLVAAQQRMLQAGRRFGLVRGGEQVQRLFDLTGLAELLTMADTPDELLEVDQAPGAP